MSRVFCSVLLLVTLLLFGEPSPLRAQDVNVNPVAATTAGAPAERTAEKEPAQLQTPPRFVLPAKQHVWARFEPGSWREVRITTETFNSEAEVINRSVTTQMEVLKSVAEEAYALEVQATVDLVGKRIVGDWKQRVLKLATDKAGEISDMQPLGHESFSYEGGDIECQIWELRYLDDSRQMLDRIAYHSQQFPYVMLRETREFTQESSLQEVEQSVEVTASAVPYVVEGKMTLCSCLRTTRRRAKGSSIRVAFVSPTIPGGDVAAWSSDFDSQRQLSRWSTFELLGFGQPDSQQAGGR